MEISNRVIRAIQKESYTTTNAYANITGFILPPVTESGYYDICANCSAQADTDGDVTSFRIAITDGTTTRYIDGCIPYFRPESATGTCPIFIMDWDVKLEVGDIVSLQAKYGGSATNINYAQGDMVGSIKRRRVV